jgi:hypothetical protein
LRHPRLTERKVETKIPSQGISTHGRSHIREIKEHITREETRGRHFTKYEALQLSLDTLHLSFYVSLSQVPDREGIDIPFKLQMSQLGTSLSLWATKMRLHEKNSATRVFHLNQSECDDDIPQHCHTVIALNNDVQ